jgi:hypothetical protein
LKIPRITIGQRASRVRLLPSSLAPRRRLQAKTANKTANTGGACLTFSLVAMAPGSSSGVSLPSSPGSIAAASSGGSSAAGAAKIGGILPGPWRSAGTVRHWSASCRRRRLADLFFAFAASATQASRDRITHRGHQISRNALSRQHRSWGGNTHGPGPSVGSVTGGLTNADYTVRTRSAPRDSFASYGALGCRRLGMSAALANAAVFSRSNMRSSPCARTK